MRRIIWVIQCAFVLLFSLPAYLPAADEIPPPVIGVPFSEKELKAYSVKGQSSITGVAFGRTRGGEIICSKHVYLFPETEFTAQWVKQAIEHNGPVRPSDKRLEPYTRTTRTDPACNFWFYRLPAGSYFMTGVIEYKSGGPQMIYGFVELEKDEHQNVVVTH